MENTPNDEYFNKLTEIFEDSGFTECQMNFLEKHCAQFKGNTTDLDIKYIELKNNYDNEVLGAYVDPKMESVPENGFYKAYKTNLDHYKAINEATCDVLSGFDDLAHFTELMKSVKLSLNIPDAKEEIDITSTFIDFSNEEEFKKLANEDVNDSNLGYSRVAQADRQGIKMDIHRKTMANGGIVWRNAQEVKGFKTATMLKYCKNFMETVKDNKDIKKIEILKQEEGHVICYIVFSMGFMNDRDGYWDFKFSTREETGEVVVILQTLKGEAYPLVPGIVRFDMFKCSVAKDTDYGYENLEFFNLNMGGNFPHKLLNMVMGSSIAKEIPQLHKDLTYHAAN